MYQKSSNFTTDERGLMRLYTCCGYVVTFKVKARAENRTSESKLSASFKLVLRHFTKRNSIRGSTFILEALDGSMRRLFSSESFRFNLNLIKNSPWGTFHSNQSFGVVTKRRLSRKESNRRIRSKRHQSFLPPSMSRQKFKPRRFLLINFWKTGFLKSK